MLRSEETYTCRVVDNIEVEKYLYKTEIYNELDQLIEIKHFDLSGKLIMEENRDYENNNLVLLINKDYTQDILTKTSFRYLNGLLVEERDFFEEDAFVSTIYTYTDDEKLLSVHKTDEQNNRISQENTAYEGNVKLTQFIDHEDYIFRQTESTYDALGRLVSEISSEFFMVDGIEDETKTITNFEFSEHQIIEIVTRYDQTIFSQKSEFNQQELLTRVTTWDIETNIESIFTHSYDHNKNLVKDTMEEQGTMVSEIKYFYDNNGLPFQTESTTLASNNYYVKYRSTLVIKQIPSRMINS